jgi:hypothetical protein
MSAEDVNRLARMFLYGIEQQQRLQALFQRLSGKPWSSDSKATPVRRSPSHTLRGNHIESVTENLIASELMDN